jgi:hypothetical protein
MSGQTNKWKSGLAWVLLSPLVLLMALIATPPPAVESLTDYYVQVAVFGAWAACGVVVGIARMASAPWAVRLQGILLWILGVYFCACAILLAVLSILSFFKPETDAWGLGLLYIAVWVFLTGVPFLYFARRRKMRE